MLGKLIVITGFPASGKDTLIDLLIEKYPSYKKIITHSSRLPRQGEINGVHYHFHSIEEFQNLINEGKMLEFTLAGSTYRGTSKDSFEQILKGETVIWRIDPAGAAKLEENIYEKFDGKTASAIVERCIKIFIKTSSHKELMTRYMSRGSEGLAEFKKRLNADIKIFKIHKDKFPYVVINKKGKHNEALAEIENIIDSCNF